jgi:hypothetical protein
MVNVKYFSESGTDEDWSGAVQAAIDSVNAGNGSERGATIFFPPGTYRIAKTVILGKNREQHGTRPSRYGAVLVGTKTLGAQPSDYAEREKKVKEAGDKFTLKALPCELDFDGKNVGRVVLELCRPPGKDAPEVLERSTYEGASFVVEGLTFHREASMTGVGAYVHDADSGKFEAREFALRTEQQGSEGEKTGRQEGLPATE